MIMILRIARVGLSIVTGSLLGWLLLQGLQALTGALPVGPIRENLLRSLANGSLVADNYTFGDTSRGNEQFTDAALLGMLVADDRGWPQRGFSARVLVRQGSDAYDPAPDLVGFLQGKLEANPTSPIAQVERYWYGARLPAGILLEFWDLGTSRSILRFAGWLSLIVMGAAGVRAGSGLVVLAVWFGFCEFLMGPMRYYGANFTHGVPLIWANVFATALFIYAKRGTRWSAEREVAVLAVAGAIATYFDCLSGSLWFSFGFMIAVLPWVLGVHRITGLRVVAQTLVALGAFTAGCVIPLLIKQIVAGILLGGNPFAQMLATGRYRLGVGQDISISAIWEKLVGASRWIGWGDAVAGKIIWCGGFLLIFAAVALWIWALLRGRHGALVMFCWTIAATLFPLSWYALMRNHTLIHAWFSVTWIFLPVAAAAASIQFFCRRITLGDGKI